jgi:hypothetical protein
MMLAEIKPITVEGRLLRWITNKSLAFVTRT